jgi:hypothetical protein
VELENIENNNTNNDTFNDINLGSLASPRGKPLAKQISNTKILKTTFPCLILLFILVISSKKHSRGIYL